MKKTIKKTSQLKPPFPINCLQCQKKFSISLTKKLKMPPLHPGTILKEKLLREKISQTQLARDLKVSFRRINEICQGKRPITFDTALRLSAYFGTSPELWLDLQRDYELECLADRKEVARIQKEVGSQASFGKSRDI
jgi:addiction module HigA family antidote